MGEEYVILLPIG